MRYLTRLLGSSNLPKRFDARLILGNNGTRKTPLIHRRLVGRPRFHLHFTPTGTSWINQVERWSALLDRKAPAAEAGRRSTVMQRPPPRLYGAELMDTEDRLSNG